MSSALYRVGSLAARRPWTVIGAWFGAAIILVGVSGAFGRQLEDTFEVPGLDSQLALELLSSTQSDRAGLTARVVVAPLDSSANFFDSEAARVGLADVQAAVEGLPKVLGTNNPTAALAAGPDDAVRAGAASADGRIALILIQYPVMEDLSRGDVENLTTALDAARTNSDLQIETGGDLFFAFPESQAGPGEAIGLVAAVLILLLAFGSLIAMGLPIGMALFGLALGVSSMGLITYLIDIPAFAPEIAAMVGLGVGIDYALFIVTRHREFLGAAMTVEESAARAVATAGQAVVFAGGTVVVAILGLALAGVPFMTGAAVAISTIVLVMVMASITLLPAFLSVAGHWVNRLGVHRRGIDVTRTIGPTWERWGRHVSKHAWPYTIGVSALLLALTAPVLALRLGFPDEGTLPESSTQRRAYDLVAEGFGPGINGPLLIAINISEDQSVVGPLSDAISDDFGVEAVAPPEIDLETGVATIIAFPTTAPHAEATVDTINRLRSVVLPAVLDDSPASAHVGGATANFADIAGRVSERLPIFIVAVIVLSVVLLTLVFRSIVVALKAAMLNLLSIGASYGVLVMVFQWGWGNELVGLETTVPIVSFIPMFMFAIVFGLSMDYEVFLLSRVREAYLETGDNDRSVIHGIASTARVITSAALIMIAVFGGFVLSEDPVTKMFGLGLATAIFVDATIVRIVLVPAAMKLMGDANWWIPDWLDRILPTIEMEREPGKYRPAGVTSPSGSGQSNKRI